ncbi:MAG: sterol desaturase family protein [Bacteroidetes bacterium]|nr:sterol desaturase family protein [Bacteroidota bacterium]MBK9673194.1 sterol desaturase family protein [Bacteroidota bacterium]MBP6413760.1 sterol desaturase family protein [Bacteroidia bacterium]
MNILLNIAIVVVTFFFMEFVAWFTHKYVMHGFMWFLHRDHHEPHHGFFEKNDWFAFIFAIPSAWLWYLGVAHQNDWLFYIGIGIATYGVAYFLVHDVIVHQRIKILRTWNNSYVRAIRRAHKIHHKKMVKEGGESFGFVIVPGKYWEKKSI